MEIEIKRNGSQAAAQGPADWFTGSVRIDPLFQPKESTRAAAASVTFTITQVTGGVPTYLGLTVTDECGAWPTFLGSGANGFLRGSLAG